MGKIPSWKSLFFLILFTKITIFSYSYAGGAYLSDEEAKEYRFKADKLQREGKLEQAIEYYQKAIGLDKYCASAYNGMAICYEKKDWPSRAEEWYLRALEVNPQYAPAHYNLGLLYEKYGEMKKAIFHWRQRMRLGPGASPGRIKARAKLKKYAFRQLQQEDARELADAIAEQKEKGTLDKTLDRNKYKTKEENIQDYYLEGMQCYQEGDYQGAAGYFHKMIETLPFSN